MGLNNIIYADPPWTYADKAQSGNRGAGFKYDLMTIDDIKALPVQRIAHPDCALFMWVTMPLLQEGLDTIKAWGFDYATCAFVWVKTNKNAHTDFMGMGNWTRSNAEICLLGTQGGIKRINKGIRQIIADPYPECITAPHTGHSVKPAIVRHRIVNLLGDLPRVELFARQNYPGWSAWGNECDITDGLDEWHK